MRETEHHISKRGYEHVRYEFDEPHTWPELINIAANLMCQPQVGRFGIYAKEGDVGLRHGVSVSTTDELPAFVLGAQRLGPCDLDGTIYVNGRRHDFYFGNTGSIGFTAKGRVDSAIAKMLMYCERDS